MNILFVSLQEVFGGGEVYLTQLKKALDENYSANVFLYSPENKRLFDFFSQEKIYIGQSRKRKFVSFSNLYSYLKASLEIKKIIKKNEIDCVVFNAKESIYLNSLLFGIDIYKIGVLHTIIENSRLKTKLFKKSISKLDVLVNVSEYINNKVRDLVGHSLEKKLVVIENGVEFKPLVKKEIDYTRNVNILSVSRLQEGKGQEDLIYALSLLPEELKFRCNITFLGEGENETKLKSLVNDLKLDSLVLFEGFSNPELYFPRSDLFIFTSRLDESFGLSVAEAMMNNVPVVSSDVGAIPSLLDDGKCGYLYSSGNVIELAKLIENFFHYREDFETKASLAYERANTEYLLKKNMEKVTEVILKGKQC
ncbi:hypothetical protein CTN01_16075 [Photobacterium angustum]|uniref:glycosyltransferase n=1 Tax=Photobacterium angustum TaxID=661 RepID=UPI000D1BC1FE|nr:glycosyltransferase [Photobacterium angustum]PSV90441.1 hypothetical protein CTN01_16075 [Photobacterium angustum]